MRTNIPRHKTAIRRQQLSRPLRLALEAGLIDRSTSVLDYGCGQGGDLRRLQARDIPCRGWDPAHRPEGELEPSSVVNLGYVLNVIEEPTERRQVLEEAWSLADELLVVAVRHTMEAKDSGRTVPYRDGHLTSWGTFQKLYGQQELRDLADEVLEVKSVSAAPGVLFCFKDAEKEQNYLATRHRRRYVLPRIRRSETVFETYRGFFDSLLEFLGEYGRPPADEELDQILPVPNKVCTVRRAVRILQRVCEEEDWEAARQRRREDILVYLAMTRFRTRPRFSDLSPRLQRDVRAFFPSYRKACSLADKELYRCGEEQDVKEACRRSPVGKLMPTALYVHQSAVGELPLLLRVYEGCARNYVGALDGATIVKLARRYPRVSYLAYPTFREEAHPALYGALTVDLRARNVTYRDYSRSENPPILHRKELFVAPDDPDRELYAALTAQEEEAGLYEDCSRIGHRTGWAERLQRHGMTLHGHRLVPLGKGAG